MANNQSKPYAFVEFPDKEPTENHPPGHNRYLSDRLHGTLFIELHVWQDLHVSTGVVVMNKNNTLIKTMLQGKDKKLVIPGSSLKGCIRSIYEAITNSRMGVKPNKAEIPYPPERLPCEHINQLCPASVVFGASGEGWGWQGLVSIQDAHYQETGSEIGFIPNLYSPQPDCSEYYRDDGQTIGRKFYYNMKSTINKDEGKGISAEVASDSNIFTTKLIFKNLKPEELGTLLISLGQDTKNQNQLILKIGAGKPVGMGSVKVKIIKAEIIQNQIDLNNRYKSFVQPSNLSLQEVQLKEFMEEKIQQAHEQLVENAQLKKLVTILSPNTNFLPKLPY